MFLDIGTSFLTLLGMFPKPNRQKKASLSLMVSLFPHHMYFPNVTLAEEIKDTRTCQQTQGKATRTKPIVFQRHWSTFAEHPFDVNFGNYAPGCLSNPGWSLPASQILPNRPVGLCTRNNSIDLRKTFPGRKMFC